MKPKKGKDPERLLTEVELEVMTALWAVGEGTVKDVQGALPPGRDLAYTSVATMLKILEGKGVVRGHKRDRAYTYVPALTKAAYESRALRHVADRLFQGNPSSLVMRLVDEGELSRDELQSLKRLLEEKLADE